MKQIRIHILFIIILVTGSIQSLYAQKASTKSKGNNQWFIGINGGVQTYWGDIKFNSFWSAFNMQELPAGGGLVFGRILIPSIKLSSEINYISLRGKEEFLPDTIGFKTQALSFAIKSQINPFAFGNNQNAKFNFFIEGGIGIIGWRNLLQNLSTNDTLNNLGWTNPNKKSSLYIPLGIKFEYKISPKISTYFAGNYNLVFSDLLDGYIAAKQDAYAYSAFGLNYYFGEQKTPPQLLSYAHFEIEYDSILAQPATKLEKNSFEPSVEKEENINPFSIKAEIPKTSPPTGFEISVDIAKLGIPASGFFRIIVPGGFIPQSSPNLDVTFTKLGFHYDYDFILPMNQNSTHIPIQINLSEIEKGTYPVMIEGEIVNQKGTSFPIKFVSYIEISSDNEWNKGLLTKEKFDTKVDDKTAIQPKSNEFALLADKKQKLDDQIKAKETAQRNNLVSEKGVYHIQILAAKKPFVEMKNFKAKHKINEKIVEIQSDGWYRYHIFDTQDIDEAHRLLARVRNEYGISQAFVVYYENGKRILSPNSSQKGSSSSATKEGSVKNTPISKQTKYAPEENKTNFLNEKLIYRIEIAIGYDQPIPVYVLQNKVGREAISEFKQNQNYYYAIGKFDNFKIAQAYLEYVITEFKITDAKIVAYQNDQRIKVVL